VKSEALVAEGFGKNDVLAQGGQITVDIHCLSMERKKVRKFTKLTEK
jgi:hypothetical protein